MRTRARRSAVVVAASLALGATLLTPADARAEDDGHRFGMVGLLGGGVAGVLHPGPLPGFVGFTDLGVEMLGEVRPWGGFLRAEFLSSGDSGRWTSFAFSSGVEYRLFGSPRQTALFLRGGLAYERWLGSSGGCPVVLFVPSSCNLDGAQASAFQVTTDMLGVLGGARVEVPLSRLYLAFSANVVPTVAVDSGTPASTLEVRFTLELGFRDLHTRDVLVDAPRRPGDGVRTRRGALPSTEE